jgi:acetyltransferase-like isoleucine patch superfamily enzyme
MREWLLRLWRALFAPRMLYGWRAADGAWRAHTRVSSSAHIESPAGLQMGDHVYVGHFNVLDASGGLTLGEGVQVTTHCALLTHSSHRAIRLAGRAYWGAAEPAGFERAPVSIGEYSFIGPHSVVAPGSRIGRGVLVRAFSYVSGTVPDFAIVAGQPARVIGDTRQADEAFLQAHPEARADYEAWAGRSPSHAASHALSQPSSQSPPHSP